MRIGVALNLDVALLHDVEQADLNLAGEVGQFVDREDAAIRARQQAVVDGQFVRDVLPAARRLDRIDVADHVRDGHVRRRQFLDVALVAMQPSRWASRRRPRAIRSRQRRQIGRYGLSWISQPSTYGAHSSSNVGEHADQARLGLPAQSEKNEVVARKNGVDDLRHDGVFVPENARKQFLAALNFADQVGAELVLDGPVGNFRFGEGTVAKRAEGTG